MIVNPTEEQLLTITWIVYRIRNKIDNKSYIGETYKTFRKRYGISWWKSSQNIFLKRAVQKYGLDNFEISILEYGLTSKRELRNAEAKYVEMYNTLSPNGYNFAVCGDDFKVYDIEYYKERNKKFRKTFTFKNIFTGEIFVTDNLPQFCKDRNISRTALSSVLSGRVLNMKEGYCLVETLLEDIANKRYFGYREIKPPYILWKNGEKFEFNDIMAFRKEHNLKAITTFLDLLIGKRKYYCGFSLTPEIDPSSSCNLIYVNIILQDKDGNIHSFKTTKDFAEKFNVPCSRLGDVIRGKRKSIFGMKVISFERIERNAYYDSL